MKFKCVGSSKYIPSSELNAVRTTNDWYKVIRANSKLQWKEVVVEFKKIVGHDLVKTKEALSGAAVSAKKAGKKTVQTAKAATAAVANAVQNAKQKAPKAILKKVNYQVSDPNDTRYWTYKRLFFNTEAERDAEIEKIKADSNKIYVSKGWGERQYSVGFWQVKEAKNG